MGEQDDSQLVTHRVADNRRSSVASVAFIEVHGNPTWPEDLEHQNSPVFAHMAADLLPVD